MNNPKTSKRAINSKTSNLVSKKTEEENNLVNFLDLLIKLDNQFQASKTKDLTNQDNTLTIKENQL